MKQIVKCVKDEQLNKQFEEIAVLVKELRAKERLEIEPIMAYGVWRCISRKLNKDGSWISIHDVDAVALFMEKSKNYLEIQHLSQEDIVGMSFNDTYNY